MYDQQFGELLENAPQNINIQKYLMVTRHKLSEYHRIAVSYSGGSDSDIMLDLIELVKPDDCGEIKYIFFDTGLEWDATLRHLKETEQRYGVAIQQIKSEMSIPVGCDK
jgi:3'-phosphoadenosine 5'-phosphosulfate sulfotransferase (PAPS reductase)/FAD synthetase